jgi:murein DD-endopeptidase MepM/ murein hydrolase activator NlpD
MPGADTGTLAEHIWGWTLKSIRGMRNAGAAAAIALVVLGSAASPASASTVSEKIRAERQVERRISKLTTSHRSRSRELRGAVRRSQREAELRPGHKTFLTMRKATEASWRLEVRTRLRLRALAERREELSAWLSTWGIFRVCPVDPPRYIHNDYGELVTVPGVAPHIHRGSDIQAPTWTPIRAPFDGYASSSYSPLGGYQVRVHGDRGYVFNAHLIAYGRLGWVSAGTVIGYVGATGNSTAPHDHFEWHPWDGPAVDPYYLLSLACD